MMAGMAISPIARAFMRPGCHVSFGMWNTTSDDIAEAHVVSLDGKRLFETDSFKPSDPGWTYGGSGMTLNEFPQSILVSWRMPSPRETPAQACQRRMESDCKHAAGDAWPVMYGDGPLTGPMEVSIRSRIPDSVWHRFISNTECAWEFGIGVGRKDVQVRWVIKGPQERSLRSGSGFGYLAHGGDWGDQLPPGAERALNGNAVQLR